MVNFDVLKISEEDIIKNIPPLSLDEINNNEVVDAFTLQDFLKDDNMEMIKNKLPCILLLLPDDVSTNGHYVALAQNKDKKVLYYFDSFGYNPLNLWQEHPQMIGEKQNIDKWGEFLKQYEKVIYNDKKIQNEASNICGYYCITYIYEYYSRAIEFTPELFVQTLQKLKYNFDLPTYDNTIILYYLSVVSNVKRMVREALVVMDDMKKNKK